MSMTSVARTLAVLRGERVDQVPNMPLVKQFCARQLGVNFMEYNRDYRVLVDAQVRMHDRWGFDCFNTTGYPYREAGDCGLPLEWRDDAGPHAPDVLVRQRKDIDRLTWPGPWDGPLMCDRLNAIRLFRRERPEVTVLGWVEGCFAQAATFRGLNELMMDLVLEPDLVRELMAFCLPMETAFARAQVEACRRCIRESGPRYVLSAGCEVPPDTPAENFAAACEVYEQASV